MANFDITQQRLHNQQITQHTFENPRDVVQWLGAVQSQDYEGGKWGVAQRTNGITEPVIEQALIDGAILRTHVLRPTWHFVTPDDIRWMLKLTAPRVNTLMSYYYRRLELDDAVFARSNAVLIKALEGGKQLTRTELGAVLNQAGIETKDLLRLGHLMGRAELDAVLCSGAKRGKQYTYALLDERAPQAGKTFDHEEALAELARRYFTSRGPATLKDYVWWSGLTTADARAGLEMVKSQFIQEVVGHQTYWLAETTPTKPTKMPDGYLLPNYDEYIVGYTDRSAIFDDQHIIKLDSRGNVLFNNIIVIDGQVVGTWKRSFKKAVVIIQPLPFTELTTTQNQAFAAAAERYGEYLGMSVVVK